MYLYEWARDTTISHVKRAVSRFIRNAVSVAISHRDAFRYSCRAFISSKWFGIHSEAVWHGRILHQVPLSIEHKREYYATVNYGWNAFCMIHDGMTCGAWSVVVDGAQSTYPTLVCWSGLSHKHSMKMESLIHAYRLAFIIIIICRTHISLFWFFSLWFAVSVRVVLAPVVVVVDDDVDDDGGCE